MWRRGLTGLAVAAGMVGGDASAGVLGGHASAASVECLWNALPSSVRQHVTTAGTISSVVEAMERWRPPDAKLTALARQCGVTADESGQPGKIASFAVGGKIIDAWALSRFADTGQITQTDLTRAWDLVTPDARKAIARHFREAVASTFPQLTKAPGPIDIETVRSLMQALKPADQQTAIEIYFYFYGRAVLEDLAAQSAD